MGRLLWVAWVAHGGSRAVGRPWLVARGGSPAVGRGQWVAVSSPEGGSFFAAAVTGGERSPSETIER